MYNLKNKIEPPSLYLLAYLHTIDIFMWMVQIYIICITFFSYESLSSECNIAHPDIGKNCEYFVFAPNRQRKTNETCVDLREERFDACVNDIDCDVFISGQYNLENWSCEGADCVCASDQVYYAMPMLMIVGFSLSFCMGLFKCCLYRFYFWNYLDIIDSRYRVIGFISDSVWFNCCNCWFNSKSFEAVIHFYYYKRKYFEYNCCSLTYIIMRYGIFFISSLIMLGLIDGLEQYNIDDMIYWYDIIPLFILWLINEFIIKMRYKCITPYSKREHVLFILAEIAKLDEINVVKIISEYLGPEDLADYEIINPNQNEEVVLKAVGDVYV